MVCPSHYFNKTKKLIPRWAVKMADPQNNDAKMRLAEIYEILNEPRKALELVYEGTAPGTLALLGKTRFPSPR
jgi:hypothetical protein